MSSLRLILTLALCALLSFCPVLLAQPPEEEGQEEEGEEAGTRDVTEDDAGDDLEEDDLDQDLEDIEGILVGDEAVLAGSGYTYDPGDRRDPFRSLLRAPDRATFGGPRPDGVPGMLIDEVEVKGIWVTPDGPVAMVQGAKDPKSLLLRPGDQLFDGDVVDIRYVRGQESEVIFKQLLNDPSAVKPFREIIKKLIPSSP